MTIEQMVQGIVQDLRKMNVIQVARVAGYDPATIYKIRKTGRIPLTQIAVDFEKAIQNIKESPDIGVKTISGVSRMKLADGRNAMFVALQNGIAPDTFTARVRRWNDIEEAATRPLSVR